MKWFAIVAVAVAAAACGGALKGGTLGNSPSSPPSSSPGGPSQQWGRIAVLVRDGSNQSPIAGASVTAIGADGTAVGASDTTDNHGRTTLTVYWDAATTKRDAKGEYQLIEVDASKPGYFLIREDGGNTAAVRPTALTSLAVKMRKQ